MIRFVIRPPHIMSTPRLLKEALNARSTKNGLLFQRATPNRDFHLYYGGTGGERLPEVSSFARLNKRGQRTAIGTDGIRVPMVNGQTGFGNTTTTFIVRPLRHSGGLGWRTTTDPQDFDETSEYIQELFPKTHEYRVIFCLGTPLITLIKKHDGEIPVDQPWNHANGSRFITVHDQENNRLRHTDVVERLTNNSVIKAAHLVGVDIMYNKHERTYAVAEFNFCPALTIEDNLAKVATHVTENWITHLQ